MATAPTETRSIRHDGDVPLVDPRSPRFGQAVTALALAAGIVLQAPVFVYAVAAIQLAAVLSRWRIHPYGLVWRHLVARVLDAPADPEPAPPHRFATLVGAVGTTIASAAFIAGVPIVGSVLAGAIATAAGLGATTGFCLGCRLYRGVSLFRRLSVV